MGLIGTLIVGALAGWLAGFFIDKKKNGCFWNMLIGIIGGFIGGNVLLWVNIDWGGGFWGSLGTALVGSIIFLWIWKLISDK